MIHKQYTLYGVDPQKGTVCLNKERFPFLLGTTSYIIPDDIIPNVRMLASLVDDIELVLFETQTASNFPSKDAIKELADIGKTYSVGYTVHLPTGNKAGAIEQKERTNFCDMAKKTIDRCMPLTPAAWILHLEGINKGADKEEVIRWKERCEEVVETICSELDDSAVVAIENLGYPWHWHLESALKNETSLCCDVGHLWMCFLECWQEHLQAMLPKTRVIHLHGVSNGKDHISLASGKRSHIQTFLEMMVESNYHGIVTLEIFNEKDFYESREVVKSLWEQLC